MLHHHTELIESWIGLALMMAVFVLALWLLPMRSTRFPAADILSAPSN
jgi:hypothetical protein